MQSLERRPKTAEGSQTQQIQVRLAELCFILSDISGKESASSLLSFTDGAAVALVLQQGRSNKLHGTLFWGNSTHFTNRANKLSFE